MHGSCDTCTRACRSTPACWRRPPRRMLDRTRRSDRSTPWRRAHTLPSVAPRRAHGGSAWSHNRSYGAIIRRPFGGGGVIEANVHKKYNDHTDPIFTRHGQSGNRPRLSPHGAECRKPVAASSPAPLHLSLCEAVIVALRRELHGDRRPGARRLVSQQPRRGAAAAGAHRDPCGEDRGHEPDTHQHHRQDWPRGRGAECGRHRCRGLQQEARGQRRGRLALGRGSLGRGSGARRILDAIRLEAAEAAVLPVLARLGGVQMQAQIRVRVGVGVGFWFGVKRVS
eukprot:scaffold56467_cov61-Phaeocystis_antarctica.AAC.2